MLKLEKDIPIPPVRQNKLTAEERDLLRSMKPGDSIAFPGWDSVEVRNAAHYYLGSRCFIVRFTDGVPRLWRTEMRKRK